MSIKRVLGAVILIGTCEVSNGMFGAAEVMQKLPVDFYYSEGSAMRLHTVTVDSFRNDSDNLYMSIDDFLDPVKKEENMGSCSAFIVKYMLSMILDPEYRIVLNEEIIPSYRKFVEEDVACETIGRYSEQNVLGFIEYLKVRLSYLNMLSFLGVSTVGKGE